MKTPQKKLALLFLLLPSLLFGVPFYLINKNGTPKHTLITLARTLAQFEVIPPPQVYSTRYINAVFQKFLLRKTEKDRWILPELSIRKDDEVKLIHAISSLRCMHKKHIPLDAHADYLLIYGSEFRASERRIEEAVKLLNTHVFSAKKVALLTGNRKLSKKRELYDFYSFLISHGMEERIVFYDRSDENKLESFMLEDIWKAYSNRPYYLVNARSSEGHLSEEERISAFESHLNAAHPPLTIATCLETPFAARILRLTKKIFSNHVENVTIFSEIFSYTETSLPIVLDELAQLLSAELRCL